MIPNLNRKYNLMIIGYGGGGTDGLGGYINMKNIDGISFDLSLPTSNFSEKIENNIFVFEGIKYNIETQSKWDDKYPGAGEDLEALCKDNIPLLVTRHYSLLYEDSEDDTSYRSGPSGHEAYLMVEDKLAKLVYDSLKSEIRRI